MVQPTQADPGGHGIVTADVERVAVLDLGSTSFHLLVAEVTPGGDIRRLVREREMLRLGAVIATRDRVPKHVCEAAVETARKLRKLAQREGADRLYPVATSALRDARNGLKLADRIAKAVGSPVRMLSGVEEARLIFGAFRKRLRIGDEPVLGIDLGGGSLELAVGAAKWVHWETTLRLGAARLHGELVREDPMTREAKRAIRARVRESVKEPRDAVASYGARRCFAAGGTIRALARLVAAERGLADGTSVNELFVSRKEMKQLARTLVKSSHDERLAMPGMARRRADLLPTGAQVLATAAEELELDGFTVCDWGLREGVILDELGIG